MSDKVHDNFYHSILFLRTAFGNEQSKGNKPLHSHIFSGDCCSNSTKVRLRQLHPDKTLEMFDSFNSTKVRLRRVLLHEGELVAVVSIPQRFD